MNTPNTNPAPTPETAPASKQTPPAPAKTPAATPPDTQPESPLKTFFGAIFTGPRQPPQWLAVLAMLFRIIWPLAILGSGVALFCVIGASGWLWLVLLLIIVCGVFARPPQPPVAP